MKIQYLIPILFLAAFCTVSAQTAQTMRQRVDVLMTTNQAETAAIRFANMSFITTYERYNDVHFIEFGTNTIFSTNDILASNDMFIVDTHFVDGHWISNLAAVRSNNVSYFARVEQSPNGWTNEVHLCEVDHADDAIRMQRIITNTPSLLTINQAEALAKRLAEETKMEDFKLLVENGRTNTVAVFTNDPDEHYKWFVWRIQDIRFAQGHWIMQLFNRMGATVELASDGSTNSVAIGILDRELRSYHIR